MICSFHEFHIRRLPKVKAQAVDEAPAGAGAGAGGRTPTRRKCRLHVLAKAMH